MKPNEFIAILDFGSQYSQLIARRVRENHVYSELLAPNTPPEKIREMGPRGLILSGGPASVYGKDAPTCDPGIFELGVPVLGMALAFGIIYWKQPDNMIQVLAVIFFLAVQYIVMMYFWAKRVEILAKKDEEKQKTEKLETGDVEEYSKGDKVLKPEEERIFPTEEES